MRGVRFLACLGRAMALIAEGLLVTTAGKCPAGIDGKRLGGKGVGQFVACTCWDSRVIAFPAEPMSRPAPSTVSQAVTANIASKGNSFT